MLGEIVAGERFTDRGFGSFDTRIAVARQHGGIALTRHNGFDDGKTRHTRDVGEHFT